MEIHIESGDSTQLENYSSRLEKKLGGYPFITRIEVKLDKVGDLHRTSLQMRPKGGKVIFAEAIEEEESKAFSLAIKKMRAQIEKFKKKHYQSSNRTDVHNLS